MIKYLSSIYFSNRELHEKFIKFIDENDFSPESDILIYQEQTNLVGGQFPSELTVTFIHKGALYVCYIGGKYKTGVVMVKITKSNLFKLFNAGKLDG